MYRFANALSYILHPAVFVLLTVALMSGRLHHRTVFVLRDIAIPAAGLLPGLIYIYRKTRSGEFSHYHLLFKEERRVVLPLLLAGLTASFGLYALAQAHAVMMRCMLIGVCGGIGACLINLFWKISLHSAVAMGCAALFLPFSMVTVVQMGALGIIVGISRIMVRHHSPAQVFGGWIYGFGVTAALVWLLNRYRGG
ncbi:MAG: hypothetical protein AB1500_01640 [Bacillota bacterium]